MDSTLSALVARFPRVQWRAEKNYHVGQCGGVDVAVWDDGSDLDGWRARGIVGTVRLFTRATSAVEAVEKLSKEPEFAEALHAAPVQPTRAEYIPPTPEQLATAQTPQSVPFPAMMARLLPGCLGALAWVVAETVWLWRWHLLLFGMALACGAGGMWWLTGGGQ